MSGKTTDTQEQDQVVEANEEMHEALFEEMYGNGTPAPSIDDEDDVDDKDDANELDDDPDDDDDPKDTSSSDQEDDASDKKEEEEETSDDKDDKEDDDPFAWINDLEDPDLKERAEALRHQALSDRGRVSALNKRVLEFQAADAARAVTQRQGTAARTEGASGAETQTEVSQEVKDLMEEYPELSKQITALVQQEQAHLRETLNKEIAPIREELTRSQVLHETTKLEKAASELFDTERTGVHYREVLASDDWKNWLNEQPRFIQESAARANTADDSMYILNLFVEDMAAEYHAKQAKAQAEQEKGKRKAGEEVKKKRRATLEKNVTPGSKKASASETNVDGSYDQMFDAMWGGKKSKT